MHRLDYVQRLYEIMYSVSSRVNGANSVLWE